LGYRGQREALMLRSVGGHVRLQSWVAQNFMESHAGCRGRHIFNLLSCHCLVLLI